MTLRLSSFGPKGPTSLTRRYKVYLVGPEGLASQQQYLQPFLEIESHKWMVNATPPPLMSMIWYCWHPQSIWHINLIFRLYPKLSQVRKCKMWIPPSPEYKPAFQTVSTHDLGGLQGKDGSWTTSAPAPPDSCLVELPS